MHVRNTLESTTLSSGFTSIESFKTYVPLMLEVDECKSQAGEKEAGLLFCITRCFTGACTDFFASHVVRMTMDRYEIWWNLDTLSQAESVLINEVS